MRHYSGVAVVNALGLPEVAERQFVLLLLEVDLPYTVPRIELVREAGYRLGIVIRKETTTGRVLIAGQSSISCSLPITEQEFVSSASDWFIFDWPEDSFKTRNLSVSVNLPSVVMSGIYPYSVPVAVHCIVVLVYKTVLMPEERVTVSKFRVHQHGPLKELYRSFVFFLEGEAVSNGTPSLKVKWLF